MISDIASFLQYFEGINRRAVRDVGKLPPAAETWRPPAGEGEDAWGVSQLVEHMASFRLYFASAYLHRGWIYNPWPGDMSLQANWIPALEKSAQELNQLLAGTPDEWLRRPVELVGSEEGKKISGWRVLMMMTEHDIHHRSQIDTYAGINGWPLAHIFDRTTEWVMSQQEDQRRKHPQAD